MDARLSIGFVNNRTARVFRFDFDIGEGGLINGGNIFDDKEARI